MDWGGGGISDPVQSVRIVLRLVLVRLRKKFDVRVTHSHMGKCKITPFDGISLKR